MMGQRLNNVLRPVAIPYIQGLPDAIFYQDNARPHSACICQHALQGIQTLPWPSYSPHLSPIEHVRDVIGCHLQTLPLLVQKTNCGKWLKGNREPSLRAPSALLLTLCLDV
ncbi:hypothetical protein X975_21353, partial [Stegodyphus mimosarum]